MSILRIKSIEATAEIGGLVRDVGYCSETKRLWVEAIDADEAIELIRLMGKASKQLTLGTSQNETDVVDTLIKQPMSKPRTPQKTKEAEEPKKNPLTLSRGPSVQGVDVVSGNVITPEVPAETPETPPIQADAAQEVVQDAVVDPIYELVKDEKSFRNIIGTLYDAGVQTREAMIEKCKELIPRVETIRRVHNIEKRIDNTREVLNIK